MDAGLASTEPRRRHAVLWLIDSLTMGGAESLTAIFARAVKRDPRVRLQVAFLKRLGGGLLEAALREAGVQCTALGARNLRDIAALSRLVRLIRQTRPDVVHAHLTYASIFGAVACRITGTPFAATVHVPPSEQPAWTRERIREWASCRLLATQGTTIAVSHAQRSLYLDRGLLNPARTIVIHNGIEAGDVPTADGGRGALLRREMGWPDDAAVITTVAVLRDRSKGVHILLDAARQVCASGPRPVRFLVVGDGPARAELERTARTGGLDGVVRWTGQRSDVAALLSGSDIFVLPTLRDQFPTVLLEAMAAALPVISTTVGGVPEIVQHAVTGLLVPPEDANALGGAICRVVSNPQERDRMGRSGRARVLAHFSAQRWLDQLSDLYAAASARTVHAAIPALARQVS